LDRLLLTWKNTPSKTFSDLYRGTNERMIRLSAAQA